VPPIFFFLCSAGRLEYKEQKAFGIARFANRIPFPFRPIYIYRCWQIIFQCGVMPFALLIGLREFIYFEKDKRKDIKNDQVPL